MFLYKSNDVLKLRNC